MKRTATLFIIGLFMMQSSFAGGIVTNTNQSALFLRMLARNASLGIDAVYYNPAGIVKMSDGLYVSVQNQTIFQTRTITNSFAFLNTAEFIGNVTVPIYPSVFGVYKKGKIAVSFGFGVVGGGGSAIYDEGLPSFETPIAQVPLLLQSMKVPTSQYSADINLEGFSAILGGQLGISYAINDMFAVSIGARFSYAKNTHPVPVGI